MPDIFKQRGVHPPTGSVCIPDLVIEPPPRPAEELLNICDGEQDGGEQASEPSDLIETAVQIPEAAPVQAAFTPSVMSYAELSDYYRAELEDIRNDAAQQGYADAVARKRGELAECLAKVDSFLLEMQNIQRQFMDRYAKELKYLAIDIAEKMILDRISQDDMTLSRLVTQSVGNVKNAAWVDVEVSERLVSLVDHLKKELSRDEFHGRATVSPTACAEDTCRVSTEDGTVVSTISVQAANLRSAFEAAEQD